MNTKNIIISALTIVLIGLTATYYYRKHLTIQTDVVIGFAGDSMLGRMVNEKIGTTSHIYPWGNLLTLLRANDINMINLETTFTTHQHKVHKTFNFRSDPNNVQALVEGNISVVNLANNHIGDFEHQGLLDTINNLDRAGIAYVGAGKNINDANKPVIIIKNGLRIGILGFTDNEPTWQATATKPGLRYLQVGNPYQEKLLINEVRVLKSLADLIIVSAHWGPNRRERPTQEFIDFAHRLANAGMHIFHGHSAHIFQGLEWYHNSLIMYDTGDFVDDYAVYSDSRNDQSFLYMVYVNQKGIKKIELIPTIISNMQVNRATDENFNQTVERMQKLSAEFNTTIVRENDKVWVKI